MVPVSISGISSMWDNFEYLKITFLLLAQWPVFLEILLMVFHSLIESCCGFNLGKDLSFAKFARSIYSFFSLFGNSLFFFIVKEYRRSRLCSDVGSLPIMCFWIMVLQNISNSSSYETCDGSYCTSAASARPVFICTHVFISRIFEPASSIS